jgi:putative endonuclease
MVRCADDTLYTGVTVDTTRRLLEHNQSSSLAAKYTRSRRPVVLVFSEAQNSKREAYQREHAIKRMTRALKLNLIGEM